MVVQGDYFHAMRIPLLRGRLLTDADTAKSELVVVVSRSFAHNTWPGEDPVGKRMRIGMKETQTPWLTVVGEVGDVKQGSPDGPDKAQFYQPAAGGGVHRRAGITHGCKWKQRIYRAPDHRAAGDDDQRVAGRGAGH